VENRNVYLQIWNHYICQTLVFPLLEQKAYSIGFVKAVLGFVWITKYIGNPASFDFFSSDVYVFPYFLHLTTFVLS